MRRPSAAVSTHKYLSTTPRQGATDLQKTICRVNLIMVYKLLKLYCLHVGLLYETLNLEGHVFSFELFVPFSYIVYCANLRSFPDSLASYCDRQRHVSTLCNETGIHRVRETSAIYSVILRHSTYSNMSTSGTYILDNIH